MQCSLNQPNLAMRLAHMSHVFDNCDLLPWNTYNQIPIPEAGSYGWPFLGLALCLGIGTTQEETKTSKTS